MAEYNGDVKDALKAVDGITNSRDLAQFESILNNDPFADGPEWQRVRDALGAREREIQSAEAEASRAVRQDEHRSIMDALASVQTKGSGTNIRQAVKNGRRVPITGNGFSVPSSGSGDSDGNDPYRAGLSLFVERYIRPNLSEGYVTRSAGGRGILQSGNELLDKEGVVPPDAGRAGLTEFLTHMAEDGTLDAAGVDAFAKEKGLSAAAASRARGVARKTARASAGPSEAKAQTTLKKSIKADVLKDTDAKMKSLYQMGYLSGKRDAGAYTGAVQGDGLVGMPQDGSGGGNGGSGGGNGGGAGAGADGNDKPTADEKQKVRDENRQHRDEGADIRAKMRVEDKQQRDEASVIRENKRRDEAEARKGVTAENRQHRDEAWYAKDQAKKNKEDRKNEYEQAKKHAEAFEESQKKAEEAAAKNTPEEQKAEAKKRGGKRSSFDLYKMALLGGELQSSVRSGMQTGQAVGAVAFGLTHAVTGAASLFVHAGQTALGLFLSPFGQTGSALTSIAGGIGQGFVALLGAAGGIASAGIKIGVGLAGGIAGGLLTVGGQVIGGAIGGIIGLLGGPGGVLAGAILGGGIATGIVGVLSSALSLVGGAVGQALNAVGSAFGQLGSSIGVTLGHVQNVLGDLIATGRAFASASMSVARGGNLSLGAAGGVASLSQMLTGSPGGLNGVFTGFGHMSQYQGFRLRAFGVGGATGTDPLGDFVKSANTYRGLDPIRRQLLVGGGYEGNDAIGNLFALNAYAPGIAAKVAGNAQKTAMTPQESVNNLLLASNLSVVEMQMERIKTKFLSDLLPAINMGLGLFSGWFAKNEGAILKGMESVGEWFATKFPGYFRGGINAAFGLAKSLASALPGIAEFGKGVYSTFAYIGNGIRAFIAGTAALVGGIIGWFDKKQGKAFVDYSKTLMAPGSGLNPHGGDKFFNDLAGKAPGLLSSIQGSQDKANKFLDSVGVRDMSHAAFQQGLRNAQGNVTQNVIIKEDRTFHHTIDMERMTHTVTEHMATQAVQAFQRAS